MSKFQRNRTKPELIRILFVTSLDLVERRSPIVIGKHLFPTFLRSFWRENYLGSLQKRTKQKKSETVRKANNLVNLGLRRVQVKKSLLLDNCSLRTREASNWSPVTFCILTNVLNSISE